MDHLPWRYTDRPRPITPNLCRDQTESDLCPDYESFFSWPDVQQWDFEHIADVGSLATYCQSWLLLGVAKVVTQQHRLPNQIFDLVPTSNPNVLDTRNITRAFLHLRWSREKSSDFAQLLDFAQCRMIQWFKMLESHGLAWTENTFNVFWSTALFHEWLRTKLGEQSKKPLYEAEVARYINSQTFITDRIRLAGRCVTVLRRKCPNLLNTWPLLSIPMLQPFERHQALLHNACMDRDCRAFHIDKHNYQMRHAINCEPTSHCRLRGVAMQSLQTRVNKGVIPVVRSTVDHKGLRIDIVDGDDLDQFVAVSHVWAGGLGNFNDNAIYECQLESLHCALLPSKSKTLRSVVYYWLDTLCVPVGDQATRQKAIDDMARIYASACRVYVLDPVMQHIDTSILTYSEQAVLIAASPWMARSWTFQEAALAVRLSFQFYDAVVDFSEVDLPDGLLSSSQLQILWRRDVDRLEGGGFYNVARPMYLFANVYRFFATIRLIPLKLQSRRILRAARGIQVSKKRTPEEDLLLVWQELFQRNSTEVQDIAAIIAVFVGRSAKEILELGPDERSRALLLSMQLLPVSLLFAPTSISTSTTTGWCPILPNCGTAFDGATSTSMLRFTDKGLIELSEDKDLCFIYTTQPLCVTGTHTLPINSKGWKGYMEIRFLHPHPSHGKDVSRAEHDIVLVIPEWTLHQDSNTSNARKLYSGICVQLKSKNSDTNRYAIYRAHFHWKVVKLEKCVEWQVPPAVPLTLDPDNTLPLASGPSNSLPRSSSSVRCEAAESSILPRSKVRETDIRLPIILDMSESNRPRVSNLY